MVGWEKETMTENLPAKKEKIIKKRRLNPKQELFCQLYASDEEFFGNGVKSYKKAYKMDDYKSAMVLASNLLRNIKILDRINVLMDIVINNVVVDKELAFVIKQKENLPAKVSAIKEYNVLKGRIIQKIEKEERILIINLHKDA
ncbi:hypothetical protein LCGC14_0399100 [marine sediment metagenome]|uniref:Terminase small subunit n=1 Tax=marine sediment metagenome TaxID=412755 RepID=A0A0F9T2Y1_9ZZZZ